MPGITLAQNAVLSCQVEPAETLSKGLHVPPWWGRPCGCTDRSPAARFKAVQFCRGHMLYARAKRPRRSSKNAIKVQPMPQTTKFLRFWRLSCIIRPAQAATVAQLAVQTIRNRQVMGSNPIGGSREREHPVLLAGCSLFRKSKAAQSVGDGIQNIACQHRGRCADFFSGQQARLGVQPGPGHSGGVGPKALGAQAGD